jgi:hypothetical protein
MATNDSFEFDYIPGYTKPTHEYGTEFGDEFHAPRVAELLKSYARFTQFGVTLAGGQGVLPTGCALAQKTSDKKYYLYAASQSDGRQNCLGFLRDARDTGGTNSPSGKVATDCLGNIVVGGILDLTLLSGTDTASLVTAAGGGIGSSAAAGSSGGGVVTQLKGRVDTVNNLFYF